MAEDSLVRYHPTIHDMPTGERPRERLIRVGAAALSTSELLAILLRIGSQGENALALSTRLLIEFGGLAGLVKASFTDLAQVKGVGPAKTAQLKAALELGRRLLLTAPNQRPQITTPLDAANLLMLEMGMLEQEQFRVLLLDTKNYLVASPTLYMGSVNTSVVRIAEVFRDAIRQNATSIVLAHNHPSGDPTPSPEDVAVTRQIVEAGRLLDIEVLDHLVIGQQRFVSMKERGLGFD